MIKYSSNKWIMILGIIVISFVLRLCILPLREVIEYDGVHWAMLGKNLITGHGYSEPEGIFQWYYPPVYPINIGLMWLVVGSVELAGSLVSLLYGTFLVVPVFILVRRLYDENIALLSTFMVAIYPPLIDVSSAVLADSMFLFILMLVILLGFYSIFQGSFTSTLLLGGLLGLLYLTKSGGITYVYIFMGWIIASGMFKKMSKICTLKKISLLLIGFLVISLPYFIFLKKHFGRWTCSELVSISLFEGTKLDANDYPFKSYRLNREGTEMEFWTSGSYAGKHISILEILIDDPKAFFGRYIRNIKKLSGFLVLGSKKVRIILILFMLFGVISAIKRGITVKEDVFILSMLLPIVAFPMISGRTVRYMWPALPIMLILISRGIMNFQEFISTMSRRYFSHKSIKIQKLPTYLFMVLICLALIGETGIYLLRAEERRSSYDPIEQKEIGSWIKDNIGSNVTIMATSPHAAFYADGKHVTLPWGELSEIITYGKHKDVDYIVIDERYVLAERPMLSLLCDEKSASHSLELIYKIDRDGRKVLLYKLLKG